MKQTENNTISFDLKDNKTNIVIITILKYIGELSTYIIKLSLFFLFLSIFIFNLQIQHHTPDGNMSSFTDIVQVDELASNLHTYFIEDCPFICIPEK